MRACDVIIVRAVIDVRGGVDDENDDDSDALLGIFA